MEPGGDLQFDRIEPVAAAPAAGLPCASCAQPIAQTYWDIGGGRMLCDPCKAKVEAALTGGSTMRRFLGALAYGGIASAAGAILYFAVVKLTGYELGLISILVGWMVGTGVRKGTGGRGGRWYQVLALVLTYCSVAASYAPMIYASFVKDGELTSTFERVFAVVFSYAVGFAAPVIILVTEPGSGILGVLIIGFGLHQAWRIPKAFAFQPQGPFTLAPQPAAPEPAHDAVA
jgi:hypothetical protein